MSSEATAQIRASAEGATHAVAEDRVVEDQDDVAARAPDVEARFAPAQAPDPDASGTALADRHGPDHAGVRDGELGDVRPRGHGDDTWPRVRDRCRFRADPARPGGRDPVA